MTEKQKKTCVLVVDDHPGVLKFIEIDLKLRGFEVISTTSCRQALVLTKSAKPDIVLLDMIMPDMSGFDMLKELRTYTDLPVIAFSASPGNQEEALRLGANDFVHKPFHPDDMARRIKTFTE
jgi:two-component system KDP operon response regulator KdpE